MINCFKNFWRDIKNSIYGRDYKGHFASRTFWQGIGFLSKVTLVEVLIFVIIFVVVAIPFFKFVLDRNNIAAFVDSYVPEGVHIEIKDGKVSTPNNEPVIVPVPEEFEKETEVAAEGESEMENKLENILVVDPNITSDEISKFDEYNTAVLITSDKIVSVEDGSLKVSSLEDVPDYVITRDSIIGLYEKIRPYIYVMGIVGSLLLFALLFVLTMIFTLIINLFAALVTLMVSMIKRVPLTYNQSYIINLFAFTPITILSAISFLVFQKPLGILVGTGVLVVLVFVNLNKKEIQEI